MSLAEMRGLVPPLAVNVSRDFRGSRREYRSFAEAERRSESGYASADLATIVVEKTEIFKSSTSAHDQTVSLHEFALFSALSSLPASGPITVLDFGGGAGATYYRARNWVSAPSVQWCVVETAVMVSEAGSTSTDELSFHAGISSATEEMLKPPDLILISSALQYLDQPEAVLENLLDIEAGSFVVARTPLATSAQTHILIQKSRLSENGPGPLPPGTQDASVKYPVTYLPFDTVSSRLTARYQRVHHIVEEPRLRRLRGGVIIGQHSFCASKPLKR
jgi:putative methyltransferase (TIGR04325 family)